MLSTPPATPMSSMPDMIFMATVLTASSPPAAAGSVFELHGEAPKHHDKWKPRIWIGRRAAEPSPSAPDPAEPKKVHYKGEAAGDEGSHHWYDKLFHRNR